MKVKRMQDSILGQLHKHVTTSQLTSDRPNFLNKLLAATRDLSETALQGAKRARRLQADYPGVAMPKGLEAVVSQCMRKWFIFFYSNFVIFVIRYFLIFYSLPRNLLVVFFLIFSKWSVLYGLVRNQFISCGAHAKYFMYVF